MRMRRERRREKWGIKWNEMKEEEKRMRKRKGRWVSDRREKEERRMGYEEEKELRYGGR